MKVYIMTDMEGAAGILNFRDWVEREGRYYELGKKLVTDEVNACVRGFYDAAGDKIEETLIVDGHGFGGLIPSALDARTLYSRGWAKANCFGLEERYDVIAWVGQHAKAGTVRSHMTHTGSPCVLDQRLNGISVGELGLIAAIAGFYGAAPIFASGEKALAEEAEALLPGIHTAWVKRGVTQDNGIGLNTRQYEEHNLGAVQMQPDAACGLIYQRAKDAMTDYLENPEKFKPFDPGAPYRLEVWYREQENDAPFYTVQYHETALPECVSQPITKESYIPADFQYE